MKVVNDLWQNAICKKLEQHQEIDETISFNKAAQYLITLLSHFNRPFKVYNLGCGVKRITTITDQCPCCKANLNKVVYFPCSEKNKC